MKRISELKKMNSNNYSLPLSLLFRIDNCIQYVYIKKNLNLYLYLSNIEKEQIIPESLTPN